MKDKNLKRLNDNLEKITTTEEYWSKIKSVYRCHKLCLKLNRLNVDKLNMINKLTLQIFSHFGKDSTIVPPFWCEYGENISIGDNCVLNFNCVFLDSANIEIGDYVMIGPNTSIFTTNHPLDVETRNKFTIYKKPIIIKNNVWIGGNSTILPGVTIGENSIIGAGSVVTKDVPSNVIVAGNPARIIRELSDENKK